MWGFRRWALRRLFTLEEYIAMQTDVLLSGIENRITVAVAVPEKG
jgi:hypothetical protein